MTARVKVQRTPITDSIIWLSARAADTVQLAFIAACLWVLAGAGFALFGAGWAWLNLNDPGLAVLRGLFPSGAS